MTQKPLVKGEPSRMLYVRLPASQWRLLCDTAKARKKTVSQVVRDALTAHGVTDSTGVSHDAREVLTWRTLADIDDSFG